VGEIKILDYAFYGRADVVKIARELLGKLLITSFDEGVTSGRIVETEAYRGEVDRASHAYGGRRTKRTEVMYGDAGTAYVYLCYGIHHLFNVVTNKKGMPHAILIRGLEPVEGIPLMLRRTGKKKPDHTLTRGPGNLSKALGLRTPHTGSSLSNPPGGSLLSSEHIFIGDDGYRVPRGGIGVSPRIGVDYAGEDAKLPYRFFVKGNPFVSG
jgi:DNA-3-methyladenine glycosylase